MHSFSDLSSHTRSPCWRIVQIERMVEMAVEQLDALGTCGFDAVLEVFNKEMRAAVRDPRVVGFNPCFGVGQRTSRFE